MKIILGLLCLSVNVMAAGLPHLDLEMTSNEYRQYLQNHPSLNRVGDAPSIANALKLGERLQKWIEAENKNRKPENAIRLTSPGTRTGIPIDKPKIYSEKTVETDTNALFAEMPEAMKSVILSTDAFPASLPVNDETFIKYGRLLDRIYQTGARFKSLFPYKLQYTTRARSDVRGYYFLKTNKWDAERLADVVGVNADDAKKVQDALAGICLNNGTAIATCNKTVADAWKKNQVAAFYTKWMPASEKIWGDFFNIPNGAARDDIDYRDENVMNVPFNTPTIAKFKPYLKDNIEAEYRFKTWGLKLNFGDYANGPYLTFQTGVVPHVNGLGGNEIVMDSNQPIEEYESQWTIRHEFGHVLGLPDCYHEFYDTNLQAFVNYQLDIKDIMCSRAGDMNERIYKELTRVYHH